MISRGPVSQGTVAFFDPVEHHGSLLLDDGTSVTFPASAFDASGLRLLRVGQRVRFERAPNGDLSLVTILTMG